MLKRDTPERRRQLIELWLEYGNKCQLGHTACPEPSHYLYPIPQSERVPIVSIQRCTDRNGNPLNDSEGKPLFIEVYKYKSQSYNLTGEARLYERIETEVIQDWIREDREARAYQRRIERLTLHRIPERGKLRGTFNAISRDIYHDSQPVYYLETLGISGLTFKPFAKIRLASSIVRLHVDLAEPFKGLSKNKRRKAVRHGKTLPVPVQKAVELVCNRAIQHYLST